MGIVKNFAIGFLIFFGSFLLYFNLCLVLNINPFPGFLIPNGQNQWNSDYYFGFESVMTAIDNFPSLFLDDVNGYLENFINSLGNVANIFYHFDTAISNWDIIAFLRGIFDVITAPIQAIYYFLLLTAQLLMTFVDMLHFIYGVVSGYFNIPVSSWETGLDSASGVISLSVSGGVVVW